MTTVRPPAKNKPPSLKQRYDCNSGGNCFLEKHMHDFDELNKLVPGHNRFGDIDGVIELDDGKVLFVEFKSTGQKLTGVQKILHEKLSKKERQSTLIVWKDESDTPIQCQWITRGESRNKIDLPHGETTLGKIFQTWMDL